MKTWKEVPNLFANGKFSCKVDYEELNDVYKITGLNEEFVHIELVPVSSCDDLNFVEISSCTLIARKIEDMDYEEIIPINEDCKLGPTRQDCIRVLSLRANNGTLHLNDVIHLSEKGVYFGPQSHFETGEVLDAKEAV